MLKFPKLPPELPWRNVAILNLIAAGFQIPQVVDGSAAATVLFLANAFAAGYSIYAATHPNR